MEELHVAITHLCRRAVYLLASALRALRGLSAADAWLWLVRASACESAATLGVVLLHHLSGLLLAAGPEVFRHG
jgi:hypothetical protein